MASKKPSKRAAPAQEPQESAEALAERATQMWETYLQERLTDPDKAYSHRWEPKAPTEYPAGRAILETAPDLKAALVRKVLAEMFRWDAKVESIRAEEREKMIRWVSDHKDWDLASSNESTSKKLLKFLLKKPPVLDAPTLGDLLRWFLERFPRINEYWEPLRELAPTVQIYFASNPGDVQILEAVQEVLTKTARITKGPFRSLHEDLAKLITGKERLHLEEGEAWTDQLFADRAAMSEPLQEKWNQLLIHCQSIGSTGKPSIKWYATARKQIEELECSLFKAHVLRWFPLVDRPRTKPYQAAEKNYGWAPEMSQAILPPHVEILRGLAFCCGMFEDAELARALSALAQSAYRKLPGIGPRMVALGTACITALGAMPGRDAVGRLAVLKNKVKFIPAQKEITKAYTAAGAREGLSAEEMEEIGIPDYGLEEVGTAQFSFGDCRAELHVDTTGAELRWFKQDKPLKSVPAAVKQEHAEELKELKASVKDIDTMLTAIKGRFDSSYLEQRSWSLGDWRERYLDHNLAGVIVRRLIWMFRENNTERSAIFHQGQFLDMQGNPFAPSENAKVRLWHPLDESKDVIVAWRERLEALEIRQPFKQAHREIYLLTDAERRTEVYSNRFAAQIIRQHQYHNLCALRGWNDPLRLCVDREFPATIRLLPKWNLRAEFWIQTNVGDGNAETVSSSAAFVHLSTDQVRFYSLGSEIGSEPGPLPLSQIPRLVFSEIMRDVDLFVGVAGVMNDPNWIDGGRTQDQQNYWRETSFGNLSATAETRREVLQRLLPRLKIAKVCSFNDRFLRVQGKLRTYKIHLGSGNILMEPHDEYLCIVPNASRNTEEKVFLPFEGDTTLSIILSKAFLLAADDKISDPTITRQIQSRG